MKPRQCIGGNRIRGDSDLSRQCLQLLQPLPLLANNRVLVENQKPEDLPLDLSLEISIPADRISVAYRRLLKHMGLSLVYAG